MEDIGRKKNAEKEIKGKSETGVGRGWGGTVLPRLRDGEKRRKRREKESGEKKEKAERKGESGEKRRKRREKEKAGEKARVKLCV